MGFTEASTHMVTSGLALLMLVLSASVFFHSKFGLNLTDKTAGIGLMFGFVGSGVMLLGAVLMRKQKEIDFDDHLEPLIDISNDDRERGEVHHEPETVREPVRREIEKEDSNVDRSQTIEQAMKSQRVEIPDPPTKAWNQVHESINGMHGQRHSDTKDIS